MYNMSVPHISSSAKQILRCTEIRNGIGMNTINLLCQDDAKGPYLILLCTWNSLYSILLALKLRSYRQQPGKGLTGWKVVSMLLLEEEKIFWVSVVGKGTKVLLRK